MKLSDFGYIIDDGRICYEGPVDESVCSSRRIIFTRSKRSPIAWGEMVAEGSIDALAEEKFGVDGKEYSLEEIYMKYFQEV